MTPHDEPKPLTKEEIEQLREWVNLGSPTTEDLICRRLLDEHSRARARIEELTEALTRYTNPKAGGFPQHLTMEDKSFEAALHGLKMGRRVYRDGWNGRGMWLKLRRHNKNPKAPVPHIDDAPMTLPYIYMSTVTGDLVPWLASQTDLLSEDWHVLED